MATTKHLLFVDENNAACSQMAEVLLRHHAGAWFEVASAGFRPEAVDPRAVQVLRQVGFTGAELSSKPVQAFAGQSFDFVIALCDLFPQDLARLPQAREYLVWHCSDPEHDAQQRASGFAQCLQELNERIKMFLLIIGKRK